MSGTIYLVLLINNLTDEVIMVVSTRGRYALRVMVDLAEQKAESYIPLKDIAMRQNISQKYIESIMTLLSKGGLIEGVHGKGGGYKLNREPKDYSVSEILLLTEGTLAPVACLHKGSQNCERKSRCTTLPMWTKLNNLINDYLSSVTIADLMRKDTDIKSDT